MRSIIAFFPASELSPSYEIEVEHSGTCYVPQFVAESPEGEIYDLSTEFCWEDLPHMTQDLQLELIGFASDVGN